ncbi:unnamed protein product [Ectocarpus sp. 8 AP-2014]
MPGCSRPKCFRTKSRRTEFNNISQGRCIKPNPWIIFRMRHSGRGYTTAQISAMYQTWKSSWNTDNAANTLTPAERRQRMNDSLCDGIAGTQFFAYRPAPNDWSPRGFIQNVTPPLRVRFASLRGGMNTEEVGDFETFNPGVWFKDFVVNIYMGLLRGSSNPGSTTSLFFPTYLYTKFAGPLPAGASHDPDNEAAERYKLVKRWTRGVDTIGASKLFILVNLRNAHWILVMVDNSKKRVLSLDSFNRSRYEVRKNVLDFLEQEHKAKDKPFDRNEWRSLPKKVPAQSDGFSCGPFICLFAAFLSNNQPLSFKQSDVPAMRKRIVWSVLNLRLV